MRSFRVPHAVGLAAALTLAILNRGPASIEARAQFQTTPTVFSGDASVVSGKVLGIPITLVDTGKEPSLSVHSYATGDSRAKFFT